MLCPLEFVSGRGAARAGREREERPQDESSQRDCPGDTAGRTLHLGLAAGEGRALPRRRAPQLPERSQLPEAASAAAPSLRCRLLLSSGDSRLVAAAARTARRPPGRAGTPHGGTRKQLITAPQPICWCGSWAAAPLQPR